MVVTKTFKYSLFINVIESDFMEVKKKFGGHSPQGITQEQIDANMRRAMSQGAQQQQKPMSFAPQGKQQGQQQGSWKPPQGKSIIWKPKQQPEGQQQQPKFKIPEPMKMQPMQPMQQQPTQQPTQQQEEEPYWSGGEWEDWCVEIYKDYPEMRKYLPAWFIEAVEE